MAAVQVWWGWWGFDGMIGCSSGVACIGRSSSLATGICRLGTVLVMAQVIGARSGGW